MRGKSKRGMGRDIPEAGKAADSISAAAPTAAPGEGLTPAAQVNIQESVKDVSPVSRSGTSGGLGYNYFAYEYLEPMEYTPQVYLRFLKLSPYFHHTTSTATTPITTIDNAELQSGVTKIADFWTSLPQLMLDKILRRDGIRFLPDSFDNAGILQWREVLIAAVIMQVRTLRTLVDMPSWNEGTRFMRSSFASKNRRLAEIEANLATIEVSPLWLALGLGEPVLSSRPGGPLLISLPSFSGIVANFGTVDVDHPAFLSKYTATDMGALLDSSSDVDNLLRECENALKILQFRSDTLALDGTNAGFTWTTGSGRGVLADFKYITHMLHELRYPAIGLLPQGPVVDPLAFADRLYGEAAYAIDSNNSHYLGFPQVKAATKAIFRRGFGPLNLIKESGMDEVITVVDAAGSNDAKIGFKAQVVGNKVSKAGWAHMTRYGVWTNALYGYNFDDGSSLRAWIEDSPLSDHQWNEAMCQDRDATAKVIKADAIASYEFHQPVGVPMEGIRSALSAAYNVPFLR